MYAMHREMMDGLGFRCSRDVTEGKNGGRGLSIPSRCRKVNGPLFRSFVWTNIESGRVEEDGRDVVDAEREA